MLETNTSEQKFWDAPASLRELTLSVRQAYYLCADRPMRTPKGARVQKPRSRYHPLHRENSNMLCSPFSRIVMFFLIMSCSTWLWWEELYHLSFLEIPETMVVVSHGSSSRKSSPSSLTESSSTALPDQPRRPFDESLYDTTKEFCVRWNIDTDHWWTHQPEWQVTHENQTHSCFGLIPNPEKRVFFRKLYELQFHSDCSNTLTKEMVNQGWGADLRGVFEGLAYAMAHHRPLQFYLRPGESWIYTVGPQAVINGTRQFINAEAAQTRACPSVNMECYFLPIGACPADPSDVMSTSDLSMLASDEGNAPQLPPLDSQQGGWFLEYATRTKSFLRQRVVEFLSHQPTLSPPCTVLHVRRADVVLNPFSNITRRYYPIEAYMQAGGSAIAPTILLLTDDQNAISEAQYKYRESDGYRWVFLNRTRHRGAEGGFENQIPSGDPVQEVAVLLATFRLVQQCNSIVHSFSSFPYYLRAIMQSNRGDNGAITKIDLDDANHGSNSVWKAGNDVFRNISRSYDV